MERSNVCHWEKGQIPLALACGSTFLITFQSKNRLRFELSLKCSVTPAHTTDWEAERKRPLFSAFFCWNSTLAPKKGAEITLACASKSSSADWGRRIIFGRHLSLCLPVSHCEPGSATQTGLCLKCLQETLMWKSTSRAVKGVVGKKAPVFKGLPLELGKTKILKDLALGTL